MESKLTKAQRQVIWEQMLSDGSHVRYYKGVDFLKKKDEYQSSLFSGTGGNVEHVYKTSGIKMPKFIEYLLIQDNYYF